MTPATEAFTALHQSLEVAGVRYAVSGSWASTAFGEPRFTNGIDILADFSPANLERFLASLPSSIYVDPDNARAAVKAGRPFNLIYMPLVFKLDLFPASSFPLGLEELDRALLVANSGLSDAPVPFVTPEDILVAKLHWFRAGGEVSEVQWRDIRGLVRGRYRQLDRQYLERTADQLAVLDLLKSVLSEV